MLKKFLKLIKKNEVVKDEVKQLVNKDEEVTNIEIEAKDEDTTTPKIIKDEQKYLEDDVIDKKIEDCTDDIVEKENIEIDVEEYKEEIDIIEDYECKDKEKEEETEEHICLDEREKDSEEDEETEIKEDEEINEDYIYSDADIEFLKEVKIRRGKSIKSIDLYTKEEKIFKTHIECSRKLKIPIGYVKENLKYGYTDYLGEAIIYLNKELQSGDNDSDFDYLNTGKNPMEIYNNLNNKIFSSRVSESKRESILSNDKIEPINMHYTFECIDEEYDDYFVKYRSIIQRGGKKKIELVDRKGEAIEIFKSLDECSNYLNKDKSEIVKMLKYGETKAGRYEIRYSLRNI